MRKLMSFVLLAVAMSLSLTATADEGSTLRAVQVETSDVGAYVERLKEGKKLIHAVNENFSIRAWRATYAGDSTGAVIVAVMYPGSFGDFATAWEQVTSDPAVKSWLDGLSGLRAIVSDSIYTELAL